MTVRVRTATPGDVPVLERLIAASSRGLGGTDYTGAQIEAARAILGKGAACRPAGSTAKIILVPGASGD